MLTYAVMVIFVLVKFTVHCAPVSEVIAKRDLTMTNFVDRYPGLKISLSRLSGIFN